MPDQTAGTSPIAGAVAGASSGFAPGNAATGLTQSSGSQAGYGVFGDDSSYYTGFGQAGQIPTAYTPQDPNIPYDQEQPSYTLPAQNQSFVYANPNAYQDPNVSTIYSTLAQGFNNSATGAPSASTTGIGALSMLGPTTLNTASDQALGAAQNTNINQLYNTSLGQGPSVAATTADQQRQANIQAGMAMLASQRGPSTGLGQRAAQIATQNANQSAAQQAVLGKTQEELAAQSALQGALGTARTGEQSTSQAQAGLQQQTGIANQAAANTGALQQGTMNQQTTLQNLQAALQQGQINAQQYDQMTQALLQQNQTDMSNNVAYQQQLGQEQLGNEQISTGKQIGEQAQATGLAGAGVSALATMGALAATAASDKRLKTNITDASKQIYDLLNSWKEVA